MKIRVYDSLGCGHTIYYRWQQGEVQISVDYEPWNKADTMEAAQRKVAGLMKFKGWKAE